MTIEEQFTEIIIKQQGDHFMPFLKVLSPDQKKLLAAPIKKLSKEYSQYGDKGGGIWGHIKGTDKQRNMLQIASFVCLNRADYEKSPGSVWFLNQKSMRSLIDWYVPDWFSDYVNKSASLEYFSLEYDWIMQLTEKASLQPSKELLVKSIPRMIFESEGNKWHYKPENLLKRPITLQEHIWYLFELDSDLHYSDRFLQFGKEVSKEKIGWKYAFAELSKEGKIDRRRLLKESLLAGNKNFNKVLSGWFVQLFADLQPTNEELLALQKELFGVLNSPHSKVVNTALQMIKKIADDSDCNIPGFLDAVPVLLTSDTKATVAAALMILEKIAKKQKQHREKIGALVCHVFIHPDEELQAKAANLIMANRDSLPLSFQEELSPFYESMLASAKKILENFVPAEGAEQKSSFAEMHAEPSGELPAIPTIEHIDDLVFLASQVFDNNQPWHISVFPDALIRWQKEIRFENFSKFEPALQRALKMIKSGFNSQQGQLDHMLAVFFIDVCVFWVRTYPAESKALEDLFEKHKQVDGQEVRRWTNMDADATYLKGWESQSKDPMYLPYHQLLMAALEKIRANDDFPLLSAPSHEPGWIDPVVFTERIAQYEKHKRSPYDMDLQVAISRCHLQETSEAIEIAEQKLNGEHKNLLLFLFDKNKEPKPPFSNPAAWMMASLAKKEKKTYKAFETFPWYRHPFNNYTCLLRWQSVDEEYTYTRYDYESKKDVEQKKRQKILRIFKENNETKQNPIKKIISKISGSNQDAAHPALCDCMHLKSQYITAEHNDIKRILLLTPNNPEPLLAETLNHCLRYPTFWQETDKRFVIATLQMLHEIWNDYGEMAHVFIGTCMISSDKTVTNLAAEIWINAVSTGKINHEKLGEVIGKHESIEFAPLKRFTDLAMQQLFRISDKHNRALQIVIENILKQLPSKPIMNLKKLLEVYAELLAVNNAPVTGKVIIVKLEDWKKTGSLQKVAAALLINATA